MTATQLPIVDVGAMFGDAAERRALAEQVTSICHEIGFMLIVDHGVDQQLIDDVFDLMARFFALPEADRQLIDKRESPWFRGWESVGTEYTNGRPDIREQIDLWTEWPVRELDVEPSYLRLLGPNQWMPEAVLPGARELMGEWYHQMGGLADRLLGLLALGLGLDEQHIVRLFGDEPMSLTKLIHYPPTPAGGAGVNAHHDAGFLTLLAPGVTPGLEVEMPDGSWTPVPSVPGSLVVNLGEVLQGMTGKYLVATPHRVITAEERFSAGYFHGPSLDVRLDPLPLDPSYAAAVAGSPRHRGAGFMARAEETSAGVGDMQSDHRAETYGEQLWNYFTRSYADMMSRHHSDA
ncbi:MAG: 2-oxoglutarate and iron-dependent oxygenase domain-containing protein [Ilumatobacter sp.]|nr:2-oxoglutarate and iron-dependent oxygenase domain-containing protein [Ilumatobacter sp.]